MKKLFGLLIIFSLLFSVSGALAGPDGPPNPIYLPVLMRGGGGGGQTSTVSGAIKDSGQFPIAGAVVKDIRGVTATSGLDGVYSMQVQPGPNTLTATRSGYSIDPQHINVVSGPNVVNFNAQVGCGNIVVNEQVTVGMGGWDFLTQHEDDVNPGTDTVIYQSAPSSGRIGVKLGVDANIPDTTRAISQPYHIPNESDADAVFLGVYVNEV
ncbi:MAG TPA: carboxypeptidase-like regulatory domain-containing protein, partial [Anaerolineales bacterium]